MISRILSRKRFHGSGWIPRTPQRWNKTKLSSFQCKSGILIQFWFNQMFDELWFSSKTKQTRLPKTSVKIEFFILISSNTDSLLYLINKYCHFQWIFAGYFAIPTKLLDIWLQRKKQQMLRDDLVECLNCINCIWQMDYAVYRQMLSYFCVFINSFDLVLITLLKLYCFSIRMKYCYD